MNVGGTTIHVTAPSVLGVPVSTSIRGPHSNYSTHITISNPSSGTMPQRSPFAIQELLGLGDSNAATSHHHQHHHQHRSPTAGISAITPNNGGSGNYGLGTGNSQHQRVLPPTSCFSTSSAADPGSGLHHHHMSMAAAANNLTASRMAYFNAQAAVAAAFLPHNMNSAVSSMAAAAAAAGMTATGAATAGTTPATMLGLNHHRHDTANTTGEPLDLNILNYVPCPYSKTKCILPMTSLSSSVFFSQCYFSSTVANVFL